MVNAHFAPRRLTVSARVQLLLYPCHCELAVLADDGQVEHVKIEEDEMPAAAAAHLTPYEKALLRQAVREYINEPKLMDYGTFAH